MTPMMALIAWSMTVLAVAFAIGYRCGQLGERDRWRAGHGDR